MNHRPNGQREKGVLSRYAVCPRPVTAGRGASLHLAIEGDDAMPTEEEILTLKSELETRLELVNSDPEYEGEQAKAGDQLLLALVGLVIPAALMIGGWLIYG
jgi:hypothetical protein